MSFTEYHLGEGGVWRAKHGSKSTLIGGRSTPIIMFDFDYKVCGSVAESRAQRSCQLSRATNKQS